MYIYTHIYISISTYEYAGDCFLYDFPGSNEFGWSFDHLRNEVKNKTKEKERVLFLFFFFFSFVFVFISLEISDPREHAFGRRFDNLGNQVHPSSVCERFVLKQKENKLLLPQHLNVRTTALQKCEAVPRRARIQGSLTFLSVSSRLETYKEEEEIKKKEEDLVCLFFVFFMLVSLLFLVFFFAVFIALMP